MKNFIIGLAFFSFLYSSYIIAGEYSPPPPVITSQTDTNNRAYAGLKWTLNEGIKPQAVIGFRHARTESNGDTDGGDLSISAKFIDGFQLGKLRAKYFNGKENTQGEIGTGYDFVNGLFAGVGVHAPYSNLGIDLLPTAKDKIEPYFQLDTIKGNDKPAYKSDVPS